ncbi:MAG TPA: DUF6065 family protein [Candidatus Binataceae bacterium]|nr:DUF6065 family protein [Candidatus Binataceae bacterium]
MLLEAFALSEEPQPLIPAPVERDWMDTGVGKHGYRCLPLTIANTYGWQLLLAADVTASWNGGPATSDITVYCSRPDQAISNFGNGVLTFDVSYIFRTQMDFHLLVSGPANQFKDGIAPMTAVIETDWLPYTFTMNYRFTRPGEVYWRAGEAYAQICLVRAGIQQSVQPVVRRLEDDAKLAADHGAWRERRTRMRERLAAGDANALSVPWDKDYFAGRYADGRATDAEHTSKLRLQPPLDKRR